MKDIPFDDVLLKKRQLQKIFPASDTTLWRMEKRGDLLPVRIAGVRYWRKSDINQLMVGGAA
jgi:predicted DNA-binding transcriptional regulator AlpA